MATKRTGRWTLHVEIRGVTLPGRACAVPEGASYGNVHVGMQKGRDVVDRVPGDATEARWAFDVEVADGDFYGPYVHGKKGDRFFYLAWGEVGADGAFAMFRRAKLMLDAVIVARDAAPSRGTLVAELSLTMPNGTPLCAAVRPPRVRWRCVTQ